MAASWLPDVRSRNARLWLLLAGALLLRWACGRPISHPPGELVSGVPEQVNLETHTPFLHRGWQLVPLANYRIRGRVLSTESYRFDGASKIIPTDVALGWGVMSNSALLDRLTLSQGGRWLNWRTDETLPVPWDEINRSAANMHLIPANTRIDWRIRFLRPGHVIRMSGLLVAVHGPDGGSMTSSLSREDRGDGACEVMYVETLDVE